MENDFISVISVVKHGSRLFSEDFIVNGILLIVEKRWWLTLVVSFLEGVMRSPVHVSKLLVVLVLILYSFRKFSIVLLML